MKKKKISVRRKNEKRKKCLPIILRKSPYNLFLLESFFARSVSFLWYFCLRFRWNDIKIWTKSVCNIYNDKTTANIDTFYCSSNLNKNLIWRICIRTSFGVAWSGAGLVKCGKKFLCVEEHSVGGRWSFKSLQKRLTFSGFIRQNLYGLFFDFSY